MKPKGIVLGIAIGLILGLVLGYFIFSEIKTDNNKLKICPDEWYDNQMPCIETVNSCPQVTQYFIIDGQRRELIEFDVDWIKENCEVNKPTIVE